MVLLESDLLQNQILNELQCLRWSVDTTHLELNGKQASQKAICSH